MTMHSLLVCCYLYPITRYGYPPAAGETEIHLREMQALGFRSVELEGIRREHLLKVYESRYVIREKLDQLGLSAPYFCVVLPGLSSADGSERARNLELFEKGCRIARLFDSRGVLDNGPLPPYRFPENIPVLRHFTDEVLQTAAFPDDLEWDKYWEELIETYQLACDVAGQYGLTYQIHPCQGVLSATTDAFLHFRAAVDRPNLRFNLDTANQFFLKDNLSLSLRRLANHIDYIHLSDNRGSKIEHLPPGRGGINWEVFFRTLRMIKFDGHIGLDIGGSESAIEDLDRAYTEAARWLEEKWFAK